VGVIPVLAGGCDPRHHQLIAREPERVARLQQNARHLRRRLGELEGSGGLHLLGETEGPDAVSPLVHVVLQDPEVRPCLPIESLSAPLTHSLPPSLRQLGTGDCDLQLLAACMAACLSGCVSRAPLLLMCLWPYGPLQLADPSKYEQIVDIAKHQGSLLSVAKYNAMETDPPGPSLRLSVSAAHTEAQIDACVAALDLAMRTGTPRRNA
jgi:7-keto-8-aminopelargonate synthetase-like enzyme